MLPLAIILRAAVAALLAAGAICLAQWCGPDVQALVAPAVRRQAIADLARLEPGLACWTWRWDKVADAVPVDAGWTIRAGGRVWPYQRVVTVADADDVSTALPQRPVGPGKWSRKCIDVPPELWGQTFRLTGFFEYRTPWTRALWSVRQATPETLVPAREAAP